MQPGAAIGKEYLRLLVRKIRVERSAATIIGSYAAIAEAVMEMSVAG